MRIRVTKSQVSIIKNDYTINQGEYNVNACYFVFDEEYDGLVKKAIFKQGDNEVEMVIVHNGCDIPSEFLNGEEMELKVYGYELQGDKYVIRYSPTPTYIYLRPGSYRPSEDEITPTQFEQYEQALNDGLAEVDHVDVDVTKSGKTATISVTNRHNETKTASIKDGANFEYNWSDTSLGVKTDEEEEYQYVDLQGEQGEQGIPGYTPQKGVDYYTASDKAELESEIEDYVINSSTSAFNQNATQKTNDFNTNATNKTTAFNNNATSKTDDFDTNASNKTTTFNNNASSKTGDFNTNATNKTNAFNSNAADKTTAYNNNHTDKVGAYDSNATNKTTSYNNNHTDKLGAYNDNASAKTTAFNENASEKTTEFNNNASALQAEVDYYATITNALPKVTGTGESITLNDTANSPLDLELEPNLSQETTEGRNKLKISTLNEIKELNTTGTWNNNEYTLNNVKFTYNDDGSITANGTASASAYFYLSKSGTNKTTLSSGTYYFNSFVNGSNTTWKMQFRDSEDVWNLYGTEVEKTYATDTNIIALYITIYSGANPNGTTFYPMISSTQGTTYEKPTNGASPNPDYPQDIHTISGDNTVIVGNKNLFDEEIELGGYSGSTGAKYASSTRIRNKDAFTLEAGTYTLSCSNSTIVSINKVGGGNEISGNNDYLTFTLLETQNCIITIETSDLLNAKIQLEKNLTATTYVPHQEQTAQLNLPVENLFNKDNANVLNAYLNSSTKIQLSDDERMIYISCKPNTTYTITKNIATPTNKNRYRVGTTATPPANNLQLLNYVYYEVGNQTKNITITTPSNAQYLCVYCWATDNTSSFEDMLNSIQIEYGSKPNTYTPYGTTPLEYCKIGNYKDRFFKNIPTDADYDATRELGKWYLKKNIGKVVLDGSENWIDQGNGGYAANISDKYSRYGTDGLICDYFHLRTGTATSNYEGIDNDTTRIRVWNVGMTLENFKIWLSTHNTTAYYQLATPTYTLLNNALQSQLETIYNKLLGYQDQTNISQVNNDLPFNIKAKAVYDLNKLVERVTTLENE